MLIDKLPNDIICGYCSNYATLVENNRTMSISGITINVDVLSYDCSACGESFTTTESDTISLYRYQNRLRINNRRRYRILKIKKCLDNLTQK